MRKHKTGLQGILLAASLLGLSAGAAMPESINPQDFVQVERGRYLAILGDCTACHTVEGSGKEFAGGRPLETPFGQMVPPNITPDRETGIGAWTDDEFVNALTKGTGRGGERIYPVMPYTYFTKMTREEVLAIRAYLNTVPAVRNLVHPNQLKPPFDIRASLATWNALFFTPGEFRPVAGKSAEWNRGAYLVEGPTHCGWCHTPKNELGADKSGEQLRGYALSGWFAPNITNEDRRGLGSWSIDDIVEYLATGHNRYTAASGLMSEVIALSTSRMNDSDLRAIAVYLKDQPGGTQTVGARAASDDKTAAPDDKIMKAGAAIYADQCSACHKPDGSGISALFPTLKGSALVQQLDPTTLMRVVLRGTRSAATDKAPTAPAMPAFGWLLTDEQAANVISYIRNAWDNHAPPVSADEVGKARAALVQRAD
jgi:mono/diheme cytochrome c family protein